MLLVLGIVLVGLALHGAKADAAQFAEASAHDAAAQAHAPDAAAASTGGHTTISAHSVSGPQGTGVPARTAATGSGSGLSLDHVVVRLAPGAALPDLSTLGVKQVQPIGGHRAYVLDSGPTTDAARAAATLQKLRRLPGVLDAEQAAIRSPCLIPNDPFYPASSPSHGQWSLPAIGMPEAWDIEQGSGDVVVAILDTGIDKDLADFAGRIVSPYSVLNHSTEWPSWRDNAGHGTAVAAVAVAQGNDVEGMAGVAWNVKIMPVKIADTGDAYDYTLADGIYWAVDHGADVINISFAGDLSTGAEEDAVNYAVAHNVIVVAAAGNKAWIGIYFPAALPGVIAVGATQQLPANSRASFSATGPELDLVAPGTDIFSHAVGVSPWAWWSGTSFSAPMVTGVSALLRSVDPEITVAEVTNVLRESADDLGPPGWDQEFGWGLVDAKRALLEIGPAATTTTTTIPPSTTTTASTTTTTTSPSTTTTAPRFADVPEGSLYAVQINHLADLGIVAGGQDGLFHPLDTLKRQQFAKMIVLALGYPVSENDTSPFTDVTHIPGDLYPYHYVAAAFEHGITSGTTPGHFSPYDSLTRAQMITMVARAAQLAEPPPGYTPPFPNFSPVHYPFARKAAAAGLLSGIEGVGPDYDFLKPASRGEACALLDQLLR